MLSVNTKNKLAKLHFQRNILYLPIYLFYLMDWIQAENKFKKTILH